MGKSRVAVRMKQKVRGSKSHNKSEDLNRLTEKYNSFCTRLQGLVEALVNQHIAMQQFAKARFQVAQHLAVLSKDTVLFETTGQTQGADGSTDSVTSYFSVQEGVANKTKMYADKYKQFVVDYAQEWYKVVTDRVGADLKKAEKIRVELDHYQLKVENLRQSANATMAKGKQVDSKAAEKLTRNEDKLIKSKEASSKFISDLCLLMEEITERSWRDLHPLLVKCNQFEAQVSSDEAKAMASLNGIVTSLKKVASDHGIKPQARLKDLKTLDPNALSTRSKDDSRNLAIENEFAGMALGGGSASISGSVNGGSSAFGGDDGMHFPPGATHAQGLGGFPVRVSQAGEFPKSSFDLGQSSTSTTVGAPSKMSMMNINSAPAPTLDTMEHAFRPSAGVSGSAPSSGGVSYGMERSRGSMDSFQSDFSGAPAPPPSSAPPPPPPSMGDHMVGSSGNPYHSAPIPINTNSFGSTNPGSYGAPPPTMATYGNHPHGVASQRESYSQHQSMSGGSFPQQQSIYGGQPPMQQQPPPSSYGLNNNGIHRSTNTNPFG